jgi:hypothetical protein
MGDGIGAAEAWGGMGDAGSVGVLRLRLRMTRFENGHQQATMLKWKHHAKHTFQGAAAAESFPVLCSLVCNHGGVSVVVCRADAGGCTVD